ncbi:unnamed protein product, partial [Choristocarpus tenellus]
GNIVANAVDSDGSTRWAVSGLSRWIKINIDDWESNDVTSVKIALYKGKKRKSYFDVSGSETTTV